MGICSFVLKTGFLAFFALNAWNTLQNLDHHTTSFQNNYKNFETTLHSKTGFAIPECLQHAHVNKHSGKIVKYAAWATLGLSGASLLVCGGFTWVVGFLYFLQQALHLNFANISGKTSLVELEKVALAVALLFASFAVSCCRKGACGTKACPVKGKSQAAPSVATDRTNQSKDKKRH